MKKEKAMNILLPKMMVVENTEEPVVSQYDRLAGGNPGFNLDAPEWDFELTMVNPDSLKLVNTRTEMFKLSDKMNETWYQKELRSHAQKTPQHEVSYGVFLIRTAITRNFTPHGVECVLGSWFKTIPSAYEWWYQIVIVKDKDYDQDRIMLLRMKDK